MAPSAANDIRPKDRNSDRNLGNATLIMKTN